MYTTVPDVKAQFPQFRSDQWGTGILPTDAQIEQQIAIASGRVDDYCRSVYALPFTPNTPVTIANAALQLTVASLRQAFSALSPKADAQGPDIEARTLAQLKAIGEGHPPFLDWPRAVGEESPGGSPIGSDPPPTRLFTRDKVF